MRIRDLLNNNKSRYIIITFVVSAIGFLRSFVLLKLFDFDKLGIIALSQTITITISLLQIGTITGAYRLFSYKKNSILRRVNSAIFVFFFFLTSLLLLCSGILGYFLHTEISIMMIMLLVIIGVISLYSNWVVCKLLGIKDVLTLNKAQLSSAIISFVVTLFAKWLGLVAVLAGLLLQPLIVIIIAYLIIPDLIPKFNLLNFKRYIIKIISLGFVPYLTSALTFFNSQLGRWLITISLGTTILGKTFLMTLFITLISVFPSAISNLFFPTIIEKFEKNMRNDLNNTLKRQLTILTVYYVFMISITLLLANVVVHAFLPKHIESVNLIYAIIPSLFFLHISSPAITLFNAAKRFKNILFGSLISVFSYVALLCLYLFFFNPSLIGFFIIESTSALFFFIYNAYYYFKLKKSYDYE